MDLLIVAVAGLLAIAAAATIAPRIRVAAPLILVLVGIGVSFLPFVPAFEVDPEWVIAGILPPLLYSASASMPAMDFRRELTAIGGLSVVLVVLSSVIVGIFFAWVIPGLGLWWGIALGAVVSPTDAVATSIVRRVGVSGRTVSVLEGESLLNDATALVLLRTAIAGTAASVSLWSVLGRFVFAVVIAVALGILVGHLNLWLRSKVTDPTVNTVVSFTVPFLASVPAELLGASGLVAAVVAGLVTGHGAARRLSPRHRLSDSENWRMVELVLEGTIFLLMGLQLDGIVVEVQAEHAGIGTAAVIAAGALLLTILVRAGYIAPLLAGLHRRTRRGERMKPTLDVMQRRLDTSPPPSVPLRPASPIRISPERIDRLRARTRRVRADIDYLLASPLGWREGGVLVWAGMRGAITLAAAQTLPADAPNRPLLILIAFTVAAASLIVQGSTLASFVRWIRPATRDEATAVEERRQVLALLDRVAREVVEHPAAASSSSAASKRLALTIIEAQRSALLDARDDGVYSSEILNSALTNLDADQISLELKDAPPEL